MPKAIATHSGISKKLNIFEWPTTTMHDSGQTWASRQTTLVVAFTSKVIIYSCKACDSSRNVLIYPRVNMVIWRQTFFQVPRNTKSTNHRSVNLIGSRDCRWGTMTMAPNGSHSELQFVKQYGNWSAKVLADAILVGHLGSLCNHEVCTQNKLAAINKELVLAGRAFF